MRVAQLMHGLGLGGAQQVVKFLIGGSSDTFESFVYSCHGGVFQAPIEEAGGTVRIVPRRLPKLDPTWVVGLARQLRRDRIDLVHGHLFGDTLHGYLAARLAGGLPMVMTLHNPTEARTRLQIAGYRWLLRRARVPVACSEFVRRSWIAEMPKLEGRLRTVHNGIAFDHDESRGAASRALLEERLGVRPGALVLATVGRLATQKGYPYLLEALQRLDGAAADVQLVLFGDGPLREELEAQVAAAGLGERVILAGFRADVSELLPAVDVIVFSSLFEGLPIALLEAMATARCVVATDVGGITGGVRADREALIVPSRDPQRLAEALARVIEDPALRTELGAAARQRYLEEFTVERMVDSYEALYREIAGG